MPHGLFILLLPENKSPRMEASPDRQSMEVAEAMDSRPALAALSVSQQNTEADVDFSKLTPSQFGISTQNFLPTPKIKDKSRVAQLKARRSAIGVRGSLETNSLICFRAKQATKTPPRTPQISFPSMDEESPPNRPSENCKAVEVDLQSVSNSEQQLSFNASSRPTRSRGGRRKKTSGVKRRFSNEVDRSLYGRRVFVSKSPLLSTISETMSASFNGTPTQTLSGKLTGGEKDDVQTPTVLHGKADHSTVSLWCGTALPDATLTNEIEQTSSPIIQSDTGMTCSEPLAGTGSPAESDNSGSKALKARRGSGRPARQRRSADSSKTRKLGSSAVDSTVELNGTTGEQDIDSRQASEAAGLNQNNGEGDEHTKHSEIPTVVPNDPMTTKQKTPKRRGRVQKVLKSCVKIDVVVEADERIEFSDSTEPALASWQQTDLNSDDILRPVAKSRGSMRRSLRNRRSVDLRAGGLAWVDHTSPEFSKMGWRRTRGRLRRVSAPCVTPTPDMAE